ncbi:MAG: hypothetical protein WA705_09400 [Candidatus Ozemobacteraceae bacterium]
MQFRLRGVPTTLTTSIQLLVGNGSGTAGTWSVSPGATIPDGVVLLFGDGLSIQTVLPFRKLTFTKPIPLGAVLEVYDRDSRTVILSKAIP